MDGELNDELYAERLSVLNIELRVMLTVELRAVLKVDDRDRAGEDAKDDGEMRPGAKGKGPINQELQYTAQRK